MRRIAKEDVAPTATVARYVADYLANRGLVAIFPRLCVASMRSLVGWAVRNADGGRDIAHFTTREAGEHCISQLYRRHLDSTRI
jgi:hypothetical protein